MQPYTLLAALGLTLGTASSAPAFGGAANAALVPSYRPVDRRCPTRSGTSVDYDANSPDTPKIPS